MHMCSHQIHTTESKSGRCNLLNIVVTLIFLGDRLLNGSPYPIRPLSCPVCLSVCNVGVLWPNGWMDQDATYYAIGLGSGHTVLYGDPAPPPTKKGGTATPSPLIGPCIVAKWIKMPLGTEVDLGPGHIRLDADPAPHAPERGTAALPPPHLDHNAASYKHRQNVLNSCRLTRCKEDKKH